MEIPIKEDVIDKIKEDFSNGEDNTLELFKDSADDVTLRTDLNEFEVILANCIFVENEFIKQCFLSVGVKFDLYGDFLKEFKRHKISKKRLSRMEFVDINKKYRFDEQLSKFANIKNLVEPRT